MKKNDTGERLAKIEERLKDLKDIKDAVLSIQQDMTALKIRVATVAGGISMAISLASFLLN